MEEEFRKGLVGGIRVGKERFWSLAYADDVVAVASKEEDLKCMMKRLERYLDRKELTLNAEKSKIMIFKRGRGKVKKADWNWKGEAVEEVKEFVYLEIKFESNGKIAGHIKERIKRANAVLAQVWGIGERKFKNDFKMRMFLFDRLVLGVQ